MALIDNGRGVRRVFTLLGVAMAAALVWVALATIWLWRNQERVVFQPPRLGGDAPALAQRVAFAASDGHQIFGYLVEPRNESRMRSVIIAFHGNADLAVWLVPWARELADRAHVSVLLPEYRGYAGIPGTPTYETAEADARGAVQFARATLRPLRIVLFGHSLGTAIAAHLAETMGPQPPDALVLQSPFTSAREMAARMLVPPIPWLWRRISRMHYDTRAVVSRLASPVFVAHGTRDVVIPIRMGRQVFAAARRPGQLLIVNGAGHNDVADIGGERYWEWLVDAVSLGERLEVGR
jgi:uncharacterized protein